MVSISCLHEAKRSWLIIQSDSETTGKDGDYEKMSDQSFDWTPSFNILLVYCCQVF